MTRVKTNFAISGVAGDPSLGMFTHIEKSHANCENLEAAFELKIK